MQQNPVHQCKCADCQKAEANPTKLWHQHLNLFLSTLDEHQRRLYVGLESKRWGRGGDERMAQITGLSRNTVAKGRYELDQAMTLSDRVRSPGGGRGRIEKKPRRSSRL